MIKLEFLDPREIKEPGQYILRARGYLSIVYVNPTDEFYDPRGFGSRMDDVKVAGPLCWDKEKEKNNNNNITMRMAGDIKCWRCYQGATWRRVAEYVAEYYPKYGIRSGNQIDGQELCREAAKALGEDHHSPPWN